MSMDAAWCALEPLTGAADATAAEAAFRALIERFGIDRFAYLGLNLGPRREAPRLVATFPKAWTDHYLACRYWGIDPVIHGARRRMLPFAWGCPAYLAALPEAQRTFFHEARAFGIAEGITYPVHGAHGQFAVVSLVSQQAMDLGPQDRDILHLAALHYHTHQAAEAEGESADGASAGASAAAAVALTPREAECLTWAANGKSAWEIGRILNISRHTVQEHMDNAKRKLGCHSRDHAVVKAVIQGLITP